MAFPSITACLICDVVRDEPRGKLSLLGFVGVAPHVTLYVDDFAKDVTITFVLTGTSGRGTHSLSFDVLDNRGQSVISSPSLQTTVPDNAKNLMAAFGGPTKYSGPGRYTFRLMVNSAVHFSTTFDLRQGPAPIP